MQNIYYKNKENFEETLKIIKSEGLEKLHILADFDRTLTKSFVNGEKKPSIISVLRDGDYLTPEYRKKAHEMFDYYHKFEIDKKLSIKEKCKYFYEWWTKHFDLLINSGLSKDDIKSVLNSGMIKLREGVKPFLNFLNEKKIPLVILSANGLGADSISLYLEKEGFLSKNIHIISNSFVWDEDGKAINYDKRVIHSFNKGESVLSDYPEIFEKVEKRKNVILLGDTLGDPDMIDGFEYDNLIKIGFLNEKEDEILDIYKEKYDVVLTGDSDGEFLGNLF